MYHPLFDAKKLKKSKTLHRTCKTFCSVYGNLFVMTHYQCSITHNEKIYCINEEKKLCSPVNVKISISNPKYFSIFNSYLCSFNRNCHKDSVLIALCNSFTRSRSTIFQYFITQKGNTHRSQCRMSSSSKKIYLWRDFAAGVCQSLVLRTFSHVGIFNPALWSVLSPVAPLPFSLVHPPPPLPCVNKYTVYTCTVCRMGGGGSGPQTPAAKSLSR